MFKLGAVVFSLSALAAAQSLSSECQSALTSVGQDPVASNCTDLNGIINIFVVPASQSLLQPITSFVTNFCKAPACSDATIQAVAANISAGCAGDLANLGITSGDVAEVESLVQQFFPLAKQVACLADTQKNEFCVTEILEAVQNFTGQPITIDNLKNELPALEGDAAGVVSGSQQLPASVACTPCIQAAYITLKDALPGTANGTDEVNAITQQCGATFEQADTLPANIVVGTGTAAPGAQKTGVAYRAVATPAAALVAFAAAFVALA